MYILFIIFVIALVFYFKNKPLGTRIYKAYYKAKRMEFPWLDNWIKQNKINPAKIRANEDEGFTFVRKLLILLAILIIGGWILNFVIGGVSEMIAAGRIPSELQHWINTNTGSIIACIAALIVAKFLFKKPDIRPDDLTVSRKKELSAIFTETNTEYFTLECPLCHCPHSWGLSRFQLIIDSIDRSNITTTTVRSESADSYGGGFIGGLAAGAGSGSSTSVRTSVSVSGKAIKDFKCLNCGHTFKNTTDELWDWKPPEYDYVYDTPFPVWKIPSPFKRFCKSFVNTAMLIFLLAVTWFSFSGILNEITRTGKEATQTHAGSIDPSLNGVIAGRYKSIRVLSEPKRGSDELYRIPAGEFFTITGEKSGNYTVVEYKGIKGYAVPQSVKKLTKNRAVTASEDVILYTENGTPVEHVSKGTKMAMLGEGDGDFMTVEYKGEVYWVSIIEVEWDDPLWLMIANQFSK